MDACEDIVASDANSSSSRAGKYGGDGLLVEAMVVRMKAVIKEHLAFIPFPRMRIKSRSIPHLAFPVQNIECVQ